VSDSIVERVRDATIDEWTMFLSLSVFFAIFVVLVGVLAVLFLSPARSRMQRGWRSLIIGFNLIMWRSVFLIATQSEGLSQPYNILLWLLVGTFIAHFAIAFHYTWVAPLFGFMSRWRYIVPLAILTVAILGASLALTFYR
jgi:hypothetical protein